MYEWYENVKLFNMDINRSYYEDKGLKEIGILNEINIFESDMYLITFAFMDSEDIACFKIYKKDKPIYDICRVSAKKNEYIFPLNSKNTFLLNSNELFLLNEVLSSNALYNKIDSINFEANEVIAQEYEYFSKFWESLPKDFIPPKYKL